SSDSDGGYRPTFAGYEGGANDAARMYGELGDDARNRTGPQMDNTRSNADYGLSMAGRDQQNQARGYQNEALDLQRAAALGHTPSVAQLQQSQGIDAAIKSQMALAHSASGNGSSLAAAQR